MDTHLEASREQALSRVGAFSRVVCGIDGSREGSRRRSRRRA
jgi:hypothetical protein